MTHRKRAIPSDKSATGLTAIIQREREATALGETEVLQPDTRRVRPYTGTSGLEMAYSYRPHVVQLDIGLLEIDGFDVARRLCRDQKTKDVSLIAMTGYGKERHHQASGEAGFSRHLVKPVNPIQLLEFLAEILPRSDAAPV